jgi:hypothetical protein
VFGLLIFTIAIRKSQAEAAERAQAKQVL